MELYITAQLTPHPLTGAALEAYLERLPLSPQARIELAERLCAKGGGVADLQSWLAAEAEELGLPQAPAAGSTATPSTPVIHRRSMVPKPWGKLNPLARWLDDATHRLERRNAAQESPVAPVPVSYWQERGHTRRMALLLLMVLQTALATYFMREVLPYHGEPLLERMVLAIFALLFCWVSAGFWTAMMGFLVLMRGGDEYLVSREAAGPQWISPEARTAIVMPICNEDAVRVFAGLRATYESVARSGQLEHFDFFILSDSGDADICTAEVSAWSALCEAVGGAGRIFYRHRRRRVKRKSGNLDDFCRRWGGDYRYMIVLDADSVMSGQCLSTLVRLMEAHPTAGIIQTAPRAAGRDTLYARIQQFSTRVYGPLFTAGLHYWQLGESHFWGHNAIIRLAPFMEHCVLAPLPGKGSLSGPIMSHDFVEAALMRRAGWSVWIAYDLDGSYEEMPPNLLEELGRDRRWCQGNLMNFRLFLVRGMHAVHRTVFVTGVMAYLSAPIWLLFLIVSTMMLAAHTLVDPQYFVEPRQLFPIWPQWHPEKALALFTATATLLFLPKILSVLLVIVKGAVGYGGALRLTVSLMLEVVFSMLLAPVRMMFHTRFVAGAVLGWTAGWKSPPRADNQTGWLQGVQRHGWQSLFGLAWAIGVYWLNPGYLWWLLPIAGSLAVSIPVSVLSSRVNFGRAFRRLGLFLIPEEKQPPLELQETVRFLAASTALPGFVDAVMDPLCNALICATAHHRPLRPVASLAADAVLIKRALRQGPGGLSAHQKMQILDNPGLLAQLHAEIWSTSQAHPAWLIAARK
ncbi:glucans biosynthesis glucosyltransferase MdoH [Herbaspirillum sp. RTI4]|uniref:glucans biosynthesis glucosyltransferase MdoH n=1 Tax=Herbaspirillum sp. RTI4 TaxID=3048640 RepID=UPI002AB4D87D|nr:glucans biosynthesis glucosyltransferase MdoH [Herbaspirillum sp. RTI4]MDY7578102.1 glucans biosynthesis glucosyltransferase MdoH [Herbaspirillum sp. RTI4]MEA9980691.1 glucans biosynthesis glucosyltransferase MdoH [Herbaspirillum sp. RTI4]